MATTKATAAQSAKIEKINWDDLKVGDVLSEHSHYKVTQVNNDGAELHHLESGNNVSLERPYMEMILDCADQFTGEVVKVGREDKLWTQKQIDDAIANNSLPDAKIRVGDVRVKGIRTIFEEIYDSTVFMCAYSLKPVGLSRTELAKLRDEQMQEAIANIEKAQKNKEGVAKIATEMIKKIQENPILPLSPGKIRVLRGFKVEFTSRDGQYNCVDMDIDIKKEGNNIRPVNINTLLWIVYKGKKYEVE
jgi:hypothetical protein